MKPQPDDQNDEVLAILKSINTLELKLKKITEEINTKKHVLETICTHKEKIVVDDYVGGDYYNRSQYIKSTVCKICGKTLDKEIKYGGFG